jgi:hypothetical protein
LVVGLDDAAQGPPADPNWIYLPPAAQQKEHARKPEQRCKQQQRVVANKATRVCAY